MISRLLGSVTPWLLAALIGLLVFQYQLLQSADAERDTAVLQAEHAQERAAILREHQQWQRQQIETLSSAMADRDRTLSAIRDDISASTSALQSLGESDAEARDWLDSNRPTGVTDWVRELQRSGSVDSVRLPDGAQPPND